MDSSLICQVQQEVQFSFNCQVVLFLSHLLWNLGWTCRQAKLFDGQKRRPQTNGCIQMHTRQKTCSASVSLKEITRGVDQTHSSPIDTIILDCSEQEYTLAKALPNPSNAREALLESINGIAPLAMIKQDVKEPILKTLPFGKHIRGLMQIKF